MLCDYGMNCIDFDHHREKFKVLKKNPFFVFWKGMFSSFPALEKATEDNESPTPGYLYSDIVSK